VGLGKACAIAKEGMAQKVTHLTGLRDKIIREIQTNIPEVKLNGHPTQRMPGNVNFSFSRLEGEALLLHLDRRGIAVSSGSACTSGSVDPSHVLSAMGLTRELASGALRISLGRGNTEQEVTYFLEILPAIVANLREMSCL
ncbi:MAG: aminotransferase class V-fold PLP-dependent enzyme, partial [Bacillota bacterium]